MFTQEGQRAIEPKFLDSQLISKVSKTFLENLPVSEKMQKRCGIILRQKHKKDYKMLYLK